MEGDARAGVEGRELPLKAKRGVGEECLDAMLADIGAVAVYRETEDLVRRVVRQVCDLDRSGVLLVTGGRAGRIIQGKHTPRATRGIRFAERDAATIATRGHEVGIGKGQRFDIEVL